MRIKAVKLRYFLDTTKRADEWTKKIQSIENFRFSKLSWKSGVDKVPQVTTFRTESSFTNM